LSRTIWFRTPSSSIRTHFSRKSRTSASRSARTVYEFQSDLTELREMDAQLATQVEHQAHVETQAQEVNRGFLPTILPGSSGAGARFHRAGAPNLVGFGLWRF
jgi:ribosomal protein L34E